MTNRKKPLTRHARLRELRTKNRLKQEHLSGILNVSQSTYSDYENENLNIATDHWVALADTYDVSVDYMMGLTDYPERRWNNNIWLVAEEKPKPKDE
ncbi:helix-turn-helix transcriptional regulator [Aerococcaceae bacterium DSM 111020]|nr:helix-turn-helix transcriptional regulator [Aerococcaceae bacterium DSM 111020]